MGRRWAYTFMAVAALAAGMATRYWLAGAEIRPARREPTLVDLEGHAHRLSEWRGKVVVLNFWATWCPPCREEMPAFAALQEELAGRGLQFVGVAIDEPEEVQAFLQARPVNYPILIGGADVPGWADSLGNEFAALPFSVVLDRDGRQILAKTGLFRREQILEAVLPLLEQSP